MTENRKTQVKTHFKREFRAYLLLPLLGLLYATDSGITSVLLYMIGVTTAFALASHVWRRVLFPYIDLKALAQDAYTNRNMASAVVFAAICILLSVLLLSALQLMRT